ncbi:MAG: hypothetical protein LC649_03505 [Bacteroidales bacterium]|nr:hypothetical protein [Bacteroidales bacterium]
MTINGLLDTFLVWRRRRISDVTFIYILSGEVDFLVGLAFPASVKDGKYTGF